MSILKYHSSRASRRQSVGPKIVLSLLLACAALTSCSDESDAGTESPSAPIKSEVTAMEASSDPFQGVMAADFCAPRAQNVTCLPGDAGRLVALLWRGDSSSKSATLWDPGGPGLGLPPDAASWSGAIPPPIQGKNVLMLMEPWISDGVPSECTNTTACNLDALRSNVDRSLQTVDRIQRQEDIRVRSIYGNSFGAPRSSALIPSIEPDWVVFQTPAPPVGYSISRYAEQRAHMIREALANLCGDERCASDFPVEMDDLLQRGSEVATGSQVALGIIAATTEFSFNETFLRTFVDNASTGRVPPIVLRRLKILGRQFFAETGDTHSASTIGMWADICPTYRNWGLLGSSQDPLVKALEKVYRGCVDLNQPPTVRPVWPPTDVLLVEAPQDLVVPLVAQRKWTQKFAGKVDVLQGFEHGVQGERVNERIRGWIDEREVNLAD